MITYRQANAFDLAVFASLDKELFPYSPWSASQYKEEFSSPTRHFFVAIDAEQNIIGYAGVFAPGEAEADVLTVGVIPTHRGKGIAKALMAMITNWAKENNYLSKVEVLTFLDNGVSINWLNDSGGRVQNLLTKGSLNHLKYQIKKTPKEHFKDVCNSVHDARKLNIATNVYLEDWSNGMRNSPDYVFDYLDLLSTLPIKRVLLPDTLGVLSPEETYNYLSVIINKHPNIHFDFHAHNDYDLSVSNVLQSLKAGCHGLHLTINGMGERAGNAPMASVAAVIKDFIPDVEINLKEESLYKVSKLVSAFTGICFRF